MVVVVVRCSRCASENAICVIRKYEGTQKNRTKILFLLYFDLLFICNNYIVIYFL